MSGHSELFECETFKKEMLAALAAHLINAPERPVGLSTAIRDAQQQRRMYCNHAEHLANLDEYLAEIRSKFDVGTITIETSSGARFTIENTQQALTAVYKKVYGLKKPPKLISTKLKPRSAIPGKTLKEGLADGTVTKEINDV